MALTQATNSMIHGAPANVLDYGAKGDGVTDDTAAINAATNASGVGEVYFPPGNYLVTDKLDIGGRRRLVGTNYRVGGGSGSVLLMQGANASLEMASENIVENLTFLGSSGALIGINFPVGAKHCAVRDCLVQGFDKGIYVNDYSQRFFNVRAESNNLNIQVQDASDVDFYGCVVNGAVTGPNYYISGSGVNIHGGSIQNPQAAAQDNLYTRNSVVTVVGTYFEGAQGWTVQCEKTGTTQISNVYLYGIQNFAMGEDGFNANGGTISINGVYIYGNASGTNTAIQAVNNGKVYIDNNFWGQSFSSGDSQFIEFLGTGVSTNNYPIIGGRKIATITPTMLEAATSVRNQMTTSVDATTTWTGSDTWKLTCGAGVNPYVTFDLLSANPDAKLFGYGNAPLLFVMTAWRDGTGANPAIRWVNNSSDLVSFGGTTDVGVVPQNTVGYFASMGYSLNDEPTNMEMQIFGATSSSGIASGEVIYVDKIEVFAFR